MSGCDHFCKLARCASLHRYYDLAEYDNAILRGKIGIAVLQLTAVRHPNSKKNLFVENSFADEDGAQGR